MKVEDEMEKWGNRWKRQDGDWCQPSICTPTVLMGSVI